jgi:hypothetical protein
MYDDILLDFTLRVIVDDVSPDDKPRSEFRASIYDEDSELLAEGWGETTQTAINSALADFGNGETNA